MLGFNQVRLQQNYDKQGRYGMNFKGKDAPVPFKIEDINRFLASNEIYSVVLTIQKGNIPLEQIEQAINNNKVKGNISDSTAKLLTDTINKKRNNS